MLAYCKPHGKSDNLGTIFVRDVNSSNDDHRPFSNYNSSSKHILDCSDVWCVSVYLREIVTTHFDVWHTMSSSRTTSTTTDVTDPFETFITASFNLASPDSRRTHMY